METNVILLIVFGALLFLLVCGALGMHIAGEKGRSTTAGFFIGLLPIVGHIALALAPMSDEYLLDEMQARHIVTYEEEQKLKEAVLKNK